MFDSTTWTTVADVLAFISFFGGCLLALVAAVAAVRFPDLLSRMHAGTKPQTLGILLVAAGIALRVRSWSAVWMLVLVVLFQMLTAPVAAHLVGRAGYRTKQVDTENLVTDELMRDLGAAGSAEQGEFDDDEFADDGDDLIVEDDEEPVEKH